MTLYKPWAGLVATLLLIAACAPPASSSPSAEPSTSPASAGIDCPDIDLRSPSGDRIALTGTWATEREGTRGGIYFLRQVGECVWFAGGFPGPGDTAAFGGPLGFVTVVLQGRVENDFLITGTWIDVRRQDGVEALGAGGRVTLRIEFGSASTEMRLVYVGGSGQPFIEPGIREDQSWIKIGDGGGYPPPSLPP